MIRSSRWITPALLSLTAIAQAQSVAQTHPHTQAQSVAQTQPDTQAQSVAQTQPDTQAQSVAQTQPDAQAQSVAQTQPHTQAQSVAQTQPDAQAQSVAQTQSDTQAQSVARTQSDTQPQSGTQTQAAGPAPAVEGRHPQSEAITPMSPQDMRRLMQMDDSHRFGTLTVDELEWRGANGQQSGGWDAQGWYGGDSDKAWLKTEGVHTDRWTAASAELLWDRVVSPWWSAQAGVRSDFGTGPSRSWLALGLEGMAPYMFDTEATVYVGQSGRTAARVKMTYDLYLTQRLILQPKAEVNAYGKSDSARALGSGVSDLELGARMRYEFRRELAPYIGVDWSRMFGSSADLARANGRDAHDLQLAVGVRFWL